MPARRRVAFSPISPLRGDAPRMMATIITACARLSDAAACEAQECFSLPQHTAGLCDAIAAVGAVPAAFAIDAFHYAIDGVRMAIKTCFRC